MMEADRLLAERLQTREQEELTDEEKAKLFMEFMENRRKHFAKLRVQEKRNRPPTKAQKRNQMSVFFKHMGGYKHNQLKGRSYDEIQKLFDKEMKRMILDPLLSRPRPDTIAKCLTPSPDGLRRHRFMPAMPSSHAVCIILQEIWC
ncbi:hypothetical protein Tco_1051652, partial [Tanacetum coccineum]